MTIQSDAGKYSSRFAATQIGHLLKEPAVAAYTHQLSEATKLPAKIATLISTFENISKRKSEVQLTGLNLPRELKRLIGEHLEGLGEQEREALKAQEQSYLATLQENFVSQRIFRLALLPTQKVAERAIAELRPRMKAAVRFFAEKLANMEYAGTKSFDSEHCIHAHLNCFRRALLFVHNQIATMPNFDAISPLYLDRLLRHYLFKSQLKRDDIKVEVAGNLPPPLGVPMGPAIFKTEIPLPDPLT